MASIRSSRTLPGRKCAYCGRVGGNGFAALVRSLEAAGVVFRFKSDGIPYLHPDCARKAKAEAQR